MGCSVPSTASSNWQAELTSAASSPAVYSITFDPLGPYFTVALLAGGAGGSATCSALQPAPFQPADQWELTLAIPVAAGQYSIVSGRSDSVYSNAGDGGAIAVLYHAVDGLEVLDAYPVSGVVTLGSGPSTDQQQLAGDHLTGSFHLGFTSVPLQADCDVAGIEYDDAGAEISSTYDCICVDPSENVVAACDGGGGNFSGCCFQTAPAAVFVDGVFDALPCPWLCHAPAQSPECLPLVDGGA